MANWYLTIYNAGPAAKTKKPLGDVATVTRHLNNAFPDIQWKSSTEAGCPSKDFSLELGVQKDSVQSVTMKMGRMRLKGLAEICKREGWRLEDPDVETEEDVDLDDPEGWYFKQRG